MPREDRAACPPASLAACTWLDQPSEVLYLGVETPFRPARKALPALLVVDLAFLVERLNAHGYVVREDEPLEGFYHVYVDDPFGNRIELMEPHGD
jgi:hypothetical protein